jgi:hypothetical protein
MKAGKCMETRVSFPATYVERSSLQSIIEMNTFASTLESDHTFVKYVAELSHMELALFNIQHYTLILDPIPANCVRRHSDAERH